jgi:hypothetical protein
MPILKAYEVLFIIISCSMAVLPQVSTKPDGWSWWWSFGPTFTVQKVQIPDTFEGGASREHRMLLFSSPDVAILFL